MVALPAGISRRVHVLSVSVASARLFILSVLQITSPVVRQRNQLAALETDVVAIGIDQRAP